MNRAQGCLPHQKNIIIARYGSRIIQPVVFFPERQLQRTLNVPLEFQPAVYIKEGKNQELMGMITYISQQLSRPQSTLRHSMIRDQVTSLLMSTLLISLDHNYHTELTQEVSVPKPFYVKKAQEYIHAHAMERIDQWVASRGLLCKVSSITAAT